MRSSKKPNAAPESAVPAVSKAPRLVKAAELVAREVVKSIPKVVAPAPRPVRMPRGAADARALFDSLFGETAKAS